MDTDISPETPKPEEISVAEAAALAGTKEANIRRAILAGRIQARAVMVTTARAEYRIDKQSVIEWRKSWGVRRTAGERRDTPAEWPARQLAAATP